jgi:hypothetical protein
MEDLKVKQVLFRDWYQWAGRGCKDRVRENEYSGNTTYSCMKFENLDLTNLF